MEEPGGVGLEALTRSALHRLAVRVTWLFAVIGAAALAAGGQERGTLLPCLVVAGTGLSTAALVQVHRQRGGRLLAVAVGTAAAAQAAAVAVVTVRAGWPAGGLLVVNGAAAVGAALVLMTGPAVGLLSCALGCAAGAAAAGPDAAVVMGATPGALLTTAVAAMFTVIVTRGVRAAEYELAAAEEAAARETVAHQRWQAQRSLDRTLHDTVLVTLSLLAQPELEVGTQSLRERCRQDVEVLRPDAAAAGTTGTADPGTGREAAHPSTGVEDVDLDPGSTALLAGLTVNRHGVGWDEAFSGLPDRCRRAASDAVDEALRNVMRHAGTDVVDLVVLRHESAVVLQVVDQGVGFDPEGLGRPERRDRLGLRRSICARIEDVGGSTSLTSRPGRGTSVTMVIPVAERPPKLVTPC